MRISIFKKGELLKDKVIYGGEGKSLSYFSFDMDESPQVTFKSSEQGIMLNNCTCKHHSIYGANTGLLCSYVIAAIKAIPIKDGKIGGVKIE